MKWALSESAKLASNITDVAQGSKAIPPSLPENMQMERALVESICMEINKHKGIVVDESSAEPVVLTAIAELEKLGPFSKDVLKITMIGKALHQLAKSSTFDRVKKEASRVVGVWKKHLHSNTSEPSPSQSSLMHNTPHVECLQGDSDLRALF